MPCVSAATCSGERLGAACVNSMLPGTAQQQINKPLNCDCKWLRICFMGLPRLRGKGLDEKRCDSPCWKLQQTFPKKRSLHRVHARVPADMPASPRARTRSHTPSARVSRTNPVFANPASNRTVKSLCRRGSAQSAMPESMPGATVGRRFSGREAPLSGFLPTLQMLRGATKRPVKSQPRRPPQQGVPNATDVMMRMQNTKNEGGNSSFLWGARGRCGRTGQQMAPCWRAASAMQGRACRHVSTGPTLAQRETTALDTSRTGEPWSTIIETTCMYSYLHFFLLALALLHYLLLLF